MPNILALTVRPVEAPDTRYRILEYIPFFEKAGLAVTHRSLLPSDFYKRQNAKKLGLLDVPRFAWYAAKRLAGVLRRPPCDAVWLCREMLPYGPPIMERLLFNSGVPVVLDVDDALFEPDPLGGFMHHHIRSFRKFEFIAPRCAAVVVGNEYLKSYYSRFSEKVQQIPTCVDYLKFLKVVNSPSPNGAVRIGWIGTPSNAGHLEIIRKPMERLMRKCDVEFRIVGLNEAPQWDTDRIQVEKWELAKELDYFSRFDIGVMPLADTAFTRGKCAFKMIQYMAAGLPVVASPVGANVETLEEGKQGFLADGDDAWEAALEKLVLDAAMRGRMGESGRKRVAEFYSFESQWRKYSDIFLDIIEKTK